MSQFPDSLRQLLRDIISSLRIFLTIPSKISKKRRKTTSTV